ncbi:MAG TPA: antitoxin [Nakamurella sp.]
MADVLIRNVDEGVIRDIDAAAARQGLSRNEYLRRELLRSSRRGSRPATMDDLKQLAEICADVHDRELMDRAWR